MNKILTNALLLGLCTLSTQIINASVGSNKSFGDLLGQLTKSTDLKDETAFDKKDQDVFNLIEKFLKFKPDLLLDVMSNYKKMVKLEKELSSTDPEVQAKLEPAEKYMGLILAEHGLTVPMFLYKTQKNFKNTIIKILKKDTVLQEKLASRNAKSTMLLMLDLPSINDVPGFIGKINTHADIQLFLEELIAIVDSFKNNLPNGKALFEKGEADIAAAEKAAADAAQTPVNAG